MAAAGAVVARTEFSGTSRTASAQEHQRPTGSDTGNVIHGEIGPGGPIAGWVKAENAKPGTADWRLSNTAHRGEIEGYADRVSAGAGDTIALFVSTIAPSFHVEAYRMGYYQGLGGRLIWKSADVSGIRQARPTVTYGTNMVEAHWDRSLSVRIDGSWPPGDYLFKLVASTGQQYYTPLTVRDDASRAVYLIQNSVTTWQAYNLWGGYDLYEGLGGGGSSFTNRARVVSFDRPYKIGDGSGDFLGSEYPLVSLVESLGLDVTYTTSLDVDQEPPSLLRHRVFVSLGHDEYWSLSMRQAAVAAHDAGVNFMFLAANAIYRHIRLTPSPLGPDRHEIDYKSAHEDPLLGKDNADVTVDWRDPPNSWPEESLIGDYYQCNPVKYDLVVSDASSWVYAGTGLSNGDRLPDVVGSEYDRYVPGIPGAPSNVDVVGHSPVRCGGRADFADVTYYSAASGAGVFATGTTGWIAHLDPNCSGPKCAGAALTRITQNVLAAFGAGPAGRQHPSVSNLLQLRSYPSPFGSPTLPRYGPRPTTRTGTSSSTSTTSVATSTTSARGSTSTTNLLNTTPARHSPSSTTTTTPPGGN